MFLALRRYGDFRGRASSREFWSFAGLSAAIFLATMVMTIRDGQPQSAGKPPLAPPTWVLLYIGWWLATTIPWFAVQVRRLHDQGRSGGWVLINAAAYVAMGFESLLAFLLLTISMLLMLLPGEKGENRFGAVPDDRINREETEKAASVDPEPVSYRFDTPPVPAAPLLALAVAQTREGDFMDTAPVVEATSMAVIGTGRTEPMAASGRVDGDVVETLDGRFSSFGYSFSTREQAVRFAERRRSPGGSPRSTATLAPLLRPATVIARPPTAPIAPAAASVAREAVEVPAPPKNNDVIKTADGRYAYGGYSFTTYEQALHFKQRQTGTLEHRSRPEAAILRTSSRFLPPAVPPALPKPSLLGRITGQRLASPAARWIGAATPVEIGDIVFSAELLYVGSAVRTATHRALVNPDLPIGRHADTAGHSLSYWPSYSEIAPEGRRAYLQWLAGGRRDPATPIGYVFLYFYGLERRLIFEKARDEAPAILAEVHALLDVYGAHHSFQRYALALLDATNVLLGLPADPPRATPELRYGWELPIGLRLHLGRKVRDGEPIDAEDALCWTLAHPQLPTRTAVTRCFEPFRTLWHARFEQSFPQGIKVRSSKTRLHYKYHAASSEFNTNANVGDLPDVGAIGGPVAKFEALLTACTEALDPLSRLLGRSPEERGGVLAAALCPAEARDEVGGPTFNAARSSFLTAMGEAGFAQMPLGRVLSALLADGPVTPERRVVYAKRLPDILDAMDLGYEPDKRFGPSVTFADDTILCLFVRTGATQPIEGRKPYLLARTMVEIAVLAAIADAVVVDAELQSIVADLAMVAELDDQDRQRLAAHSLALVANPPKLRAATKRLLALPEDEKDLVLTSAVHAILADQRVTPTEVRFLESLYKALGRPQEDVYTRLHAGAPAVSAARAPARRPAGTIDSGRLARLQQETASVSTMLAAIFREEEEEGSPVTLEVPAPAEGAFPGLDAAHSRVLMGLTLQPLEVDAFEALCRENRLLPGGAIETINDWAFDRLDDLAVEDADLICIQPHLVQTIQTMSSAA